jgi:hypothetical protein
MKKPHQDKIIHPDEALILTSGESISPSPVETG